MSDLRKLAAPTATPVAIDAPPSHEPSRRTWTFAASVDVDHGASISKGPGTTSPFLATGITWD